MADDDMVACELCKEFMPTMSKKGEEELTMYKSESNLELGLDPIWICFKERELVNEMLKVAI